MPEAIAHRDTHRRYPTGHHTARAGRIIDRMKAAFPYGWHPLAGTFLTVGAGVILLFAWASPAIFGVEHVDRVLQARPTQSLPIPRAPSPRGLIATDSARPGADSAPRERSAEERLAASSDLLDFVESIRRHPVPGGHYLALKAYDFCTREARLTLDALGDENDDGGAVLFVDDRQLDAQARLARLCGTFGQRNRVNRAALDYYLLAEEGLQAQDSRLITARRLERLSAQWDTVSRDDSASRQLLIADVLTRGDGWLIRDLAGEFEVILHTGQLMISGQPVDPAESADVIEALLMMACEYGGSSVPCTRDGEWQQLLACASAGECAPAPFIAGGNALRWRNRIREALLVGSTGIDVVPTGEQRF